MEVSSLTGDNVENLFLTVGELQIGSISYLFSDFLSSTYNVWSLSTV